MVKCAANKQAILSIVEAEQSVSCRPTALIVTSADEGRREHTIILNEKREFQVGVYAF